MCCLLQDPSYPVYVDSTVMAGNTGEYDDAKSGFEGMTYMSCLPDNGFFPDLSKVERTGVTIRGPARSEGIICML
jgi:LL-diaminopimelate aminotransferase